MPAGGLHAPAKVHLLGVHEETLVESTQVGQNFGANEPPAGIPNLVQFLDTVDRLRSDAQQILPIHGRLTTLDEARAAAERFGRTQVFR